MLEGADSVKGALAALAESKLTPDLRDLYQKKLTLLIKLFNFTAKAYKDAQEVIREIDQRVHNEFAYFSRAQNTVLRMTNESNFGFDFFLAVDDALSAVRHLLNDVVDVIVLHAENESDRINSILKYHSIADVYKDYPEIRDLLIDLDDSISETRSVRGVLRIEAYIDLIDSGKYAKIAAYCKRLPMIEQDVKKKRLEEFREGVKTLVPILALVVAAVGVGIAYLAYDRNAIANVPAAQRQSP